MGKAAVLANRFLESQRKYEKQINIKDLPKLQGYNAILNRAITDSRSSYSHLDVYIVHDEVKAKRTYSYYVPYYLCDVDDYKKYVKVNNGGPYLFRIDRENNKVYINTFGRDDDIPIKVTEGKKKK